VALLFPPFPFSLTPTPLKTTYREEPPPQSRFDMERRNKEEPIKRQKEGKMKII